MLTRSEARMGHTKRISHSRLARASANMPYKIEKLFAKIHLINERLRRRLVTAELDVEIHGMLGATL